MKRTFYHIVAKSLRVILVVLVVAFSAAAQKPVQRFEVNQCETIEFSVQEWPGDRYTWDLYSELEWDNVNFANENGNFGPVPYFENGMYEGSTVRVNNLPAGIYFLRIMVWDEVQCTNNLLVFMIDVFETLPEASMEDGSACIGEPAFVKIVFTGSGPWDVTYTFGDESNAVNLSGIVEREYAVAIPALPEGVHNIWVMDVAEGDGVCRVVNFNPSEKARVVIFPKPNNSPIYLKE